MTKGNNDYHAKKEKKPYYLRQLSFVARDADAVVSKLPVFWTDLITGDDLV